MKSVTQLQVADDAIAIYGDPLHEASQRVVKRSDTENRRRRDVANLKTPVKNPKSPSGFDRYIRDQYSTMPQNH